MRRKIAPRSYFLRRRAPARTTAFARTSFRLTSTRLPKYRRCPYNRGAGKNFIVCGAADVDANRAAFGTVCPYRLSTGGTVEAPTEIGTFTAFCHTSTNGMPLYGVRSNALPARVKVQAVVVLPKGETSRVAARKFLERKAAAMQPSPPNVRRRLPSRDEYGGHSFYDAEATEALAAPKRRKKAKR